jgi:hypothetical protein
MGRAGDYIHYGLWRRINSYPISYFAVLFDLDNPAIPSTISREAWDFLENALSQRERVGLGIRWDL